MSGSSGQPGASVPEAVPFLAVADMPASLRFYVDGLAFVIERQWMDEGTVRWCMLRRGGAALMLQGFRRDGGGRWSPEGPLGLGVSICLFCDYALALYREAFARGVPPIQRPFVGNGLWVASYLDPDGYRIEFESPTDAPEESVFSEDAAARTGG